MARQRAMTIISAMIPMLLGLGSAAPMVDLTGAKNRTKHRKGYRQYHSKFELHLAALGVEVNAKRAIEKAEAWEDFRRDGLLPGYDPQLGTCLPDLDFLENHGFSIIEDTDNFDHDGCIMQGNGLVMYLKPFNNECHVNPNTEADVQALKQSFYEDCLERSYPE